MFFLFFAILLGVREKAQRKNEVLKCISSKLLFWVSALTHYIVHSHLLSYTLFDIMYYVLFVPK